MWFLDQAELHGIRVFSACSLDGLVPNQGFDGFSTVGTLPAFNSEVKSALSESFARFSSALGSHNALVAGFSVPDKIGVSHIPQCNEIPECKRAWNDWLENKYHRDFSALREAWGGALFERESSFGNVEAYWRATFIARDQFGFARRLDWLDFEYSSQEQLVAEMRESTPYPYTFIATDFESFLADSHKHEYTNSAVSASGHENYSVQTFYDRASPLVGKNYAFDIGFASALNGIWRNSDRPFYQVSSYGLVDLEQPSKDYYNTIVPLVLSTGGAGFFYWDFGIQQDRFNHFNRSPSPDGGRYAYPDSGVLDTMELWGYAVNNYGLGSSQDGAEVLVVLNRPEILIEADGIGTSHSNPMYKVSALANTLFQLGVPFDVKYSSVDDEVISPSELGEYRLVIFLGRDVDLEHFDQGNDFGESLSRYVENGGTLFMFTEPKPEHRNSHHVLTETPSVHSLVLNHESIATSSFDDYEWDFVQGEGPWGFGTQRIPVRRITSNFIIRTDEIKFADYSGLVGSDRVEVIATRATDDKPSLLRISRGSGKLILSAYTLAFLRDFVDGDKIMRPDSSEGLFLFEGLMNEAGIPVEKLGEKVYNIRASGQRLILNEFTDGGSTKAISLNDCGYTSSFTLPAKGVLLINSEVLVGNPSQLPSGANVVKRGPDGYVVAELPGVSCGT